MKTFFCRWILALCFPAAAGLAADDMELLTGKWQAKKVNEQGQPFTQTVEIKQGRFVFQIVGENERVAVVAQGDFKAEKLGPFKVARFTHVKAGSSVSDLNDLDDEFVSVYSLSEDAWTMAANFDREREQKPALDVYHRVKAAPALTLVVDEIEMADTPQSSTWFLCFELKTADGATFRHHVAGKEYDKKQVTIPVALEAGKAIAGQKCSFTLQLDDIDDDACGDDPDNRSAGEFIVAERGSKSYKPDDNWRYTIRWHLK